MYNPYTPPSQGAAGGYAYGSYGAQTTTQPGSQQAGAGGGVGVTYAGQNYQAPTRAEELVNVTYSDQVYTPGRAPQQQRAAAPSSQSSRGGGGSDGQRYKMTFKGKRSRRWARRSPPPAERRASPRPP